jgi:diacylglycerol kinase (ATP)
MKKFIKGFSYAWNGLIYAFSTQINFKFHVFAGFLAICLGLYINLNYAEWLWISSAILIVLIVELLNTAIEILVNLVSPEYNPKAGIVKDISAAAVLITAFFAMVVGLFIFVPKIF